MKQVDVQRDVDFLPKHTGLSGLALKRLPMLDSMFVRDYRWMWASSTVSMMAMNMQMLARVWLVLRIMSDSPMAVVYVTMTFALPMMFVSALGGALADRFPRRTLMIYAQGGNAALTFVIATLDITGVIDFWHLMVVGVLNGSLMAINMPSRQAILSEILPEDRLMNGIALANSGMNMTRIIGPAVAGMLILVFGTAGVLYMVVGLYAFSVLAVLPLGAGRTPQAKSGKSMGGDIREGFSYARREPVLLGLLNMAFVPILFGMSYYVLLPAWGREALDVSSNELGMLQMTMGVGALLGSLGLAALGNFRRRGMLILVCCVSWGVALAVFSGTTSYWMAVPLLLFIGLASAVYMSLNMAMLQIYASPEMRGRIMSIAMMTFGVMPLSAIPFGIIAERYSSSSALWLSGVLLTTFTLLFAIGYPRFRRIA